MDIINTYEKNIDGVIYEVIAYADGHIERRVKSGQEHVLPKSESTLLELQTNIQYLIDLTEMNMEG